MNNLIYQTYIIALPIILTALLGYIVWLLQEQKKQKAIDTKERNERIEEEKKLRQANGKGTMLLLRVQLIEYHDKYMKLGEIPSYAYQNFCEMYDAYHALGGNGMVTKMKNEIEEIHLGKGGKTDDFTQVPTVVAIMVITYLIGYASKQIPQVKDNIIPIIVGVAGGVLGIVGMFVIPGYPANNILDAIAVGIVSGMASTGANQIYKQIKKNA